MVLTTTGKNAVRDLLNTNKDFGQLGTSTTAPLPSDTGLISGVSASQQALTSSTADKTLVLSYELNSTTANGNTYAEFENTINSGTNFNRVTFAGIQKTADLEIQIQTTIFVE